MLDALDQQRRGTIVIGIGLIVIGGLAIVGQLASVDLFSIGWPILVVAPGVLLFAASLAVGGRPGVALAIPGAIVTMVGVVLAFQSATGLWATWAYAWALVAPGGAGLGLFLYGALTRQAEFVRAGTPVLVTGIGLFLGFGLFFEGVLNLDGLRVSAAEPVLAGGLVVLGLLILASGFLGRRPTLR
jgi:hypothetical protein